MDITCAHCPHGPGAHPLRLDNSRTRTIRPCKMTGCPCTNWVPVVT